MKTLGIIPARFASTRLPGKPLLEIAGKSIIQRVYQQARKAALLDDVIVATDDERIFNHVLHFGGTVQMTAPSHQSGTDRCAEIAEILDSYDLIVNIQGDEPFIHPDQIDLVIQPLIDQEHFSIATLAKPLTKHKELFNPNIVKLVMNKNQQALYFSRSPIPHVRNTREKDWPQSASFFKHIGLYAFRREVLLEVAHLPVSSLEKSESLEQLRWLENGFSIFVNKTDLETIGIDTMEDLKKAKKLFEKDER
jgi:3-deoxy-manno-octulosonate cytidylyltransferase (CMP-KDO synthetase)